MPNKVLLFASSSSSPVIAFAANSAGHPIFRSSDTLLITELDGKWNFEKLDDKMKVCQWTWSQGYFEQQKLTLMKYFVVTITSIQFSCTHNRDMLSNIIQYLDFNFTAYPDISQFAHVALVTHVNVLHKNVLYLALEPFRLLTSSMLFMVQITTHHGCCLRRYCLLCHLQWITVFLR